MFVLLVLLSLLVFLWVQFKEPQAAAQQVQVAHPHLLLPPWYPQTQQAPGVWQHRVCSSCSSCHSSSHCVQMQEVLLWMDGYSVSEYSFSSIFLLFCSSVPLSSFFCSCLFWRPLTMNGYSVSARFGNSAISSIFLPFCYSMPFSTFFSSLFLLFGQLFPMNGYSVSATFDNSVISSIFLPFCSSVPLSSFFSSFFSISMYCIL